MAKRKLTKTPVKIKVMRATPRWAWYRTHIGASFEAVDEGPSVECYVLTKRDGGTIKCVQKSDAEIVRDNGDVCVVGIKPDVYEMLVAGG